jgi:hypothetical protein
MNTQQHNQEHQHTETCRLLEATPKPSTFAEYRAWVTLWKSVYKEETRRARAYRAALRLFHQAGGSGRKHPLVAMTPDITAAASRATNQYDRPGRARLCALRVVYKPLGAELWKATHAQESL